MVVGPDGAAAAFSLDTLHLTVLQAFVRTDTPENYLAEDVALAVEYALRHSSRRNPVFTRAEVNNAVVRVLEETGLIDAARYYRKHNVRAVMSLTGDPAAVAGLLANHLSDAERNTNFSALAARVCDALGKLDIAAPSPALCIELARCCLAAPAAAGITLPPTGSPGGEYLALKEMSAALSPAAAALCRIGALQFQPVSRRVFPSLRAVFKLTGFASGAGLVPPITEMMIADRLYQLRTIFDGAFAALRDLYRNSTGGAENPPGYLFIPDLEEFAVNWLAWSWPEAKNSCLELISPLESEAYTLRAE